MYGVATTRGSYMLFEGRLARGYWLFGLLLLVGNASIRIYRIASRINIFQRVSGNLKLNYICGIRLL